MRGFVGAYRDANPIRFPAYYLIGAWRDVTLTAISPLSEETIGPIRRPSGEIVTGGWDRGSNQAAFLFELPYTWRTYPLTIEARVAGDYEPENVQHNNTLRRQFHFLPALPICVVWRPVSARSGIPAADFMSATEEGREIRRRGLTFLPTHDIWGWYRTKVVEKWNWWPPGYGPYHLDGDQGDIITTLW